MTAQQKKTMGLVVAGLSGGSGKSIVAVGLAACFAARGLQVATFKKGPDYIDAGWLQLAAGRPCRNLDHYLMPAETIQTSFRNHAVGMDVVIVEGNRGLYDGVDPEGTYSTAELSLQLNLPVLLVVDCTKTTRTVAAMVLGCRELDPRVRIAGVVLNRLGSGRHEKIVRQAVEQYTGIPVLGSIPRLGRDVFPQRHLGVTPHQEHEGAQAALDTLSAMAADRLDLAGIEQVMAEVAGIAGPVASGPAVGAQGAGVRIGVLRDAAFQFYYPDNLEALTALGAELVAIDALTADALPAVDGLYIGGGFPETSAGKLSANRGFRESIRRQVEAGLPVYAECGGLIYLGESILLDGEIFPLAGVFPVKFGIRRRPQAHGYTELTVVGDNPFYPVGTGIRGHEFRYSEILEWQGNPEDLALTMGRGVGFAGGRDGLVRHNTLAMYTHIHALGTPEWAGGLVAKAREFREIKS